MSSSESDRWMNAIEHLKCAFKDESTISNIAQANLSMVEDDGDDGSSVSSGQQCCSLGIESDLEEEVDEAVNEIEKLDAAPNEIKELDTAPNEINATEASKENDCNAKNVNVLEKQVLVNIDEDCSYQSNTLENGDRYDPNYIHGMSQDEEEEIPGIVDLSSIKLEHPQDIPLSISHEQGMRELLYQEPPVNMHDHMLDDDSLGDPDDDMSDSANTGTTTDGGSLLLNLWNEDYDGNPDPAVMNKLIEAKRLPRKLDPYIVNQVERAKIIKELEEYEDDESSHGSCNALCSQFFIPRPIAEEDDDDDGSEDSDDSIVDTVINFSTEDNEQIDLAASVSGEATMELDISDLIHKKPKKEMNMYAIPKDSEYRPGMVKNELVLMLPKQTSESEDEDESVQSQILPLQYARRGDDSMKPAALDLPSSCSELSSPATFESDVDLEQIAFRKRRTTDDDDPIEEDRSVLSPEEIEAIQKAELEEIEAMKKAKLEQEKLSQAKIEEEKLSLAKLAMKQKGALSQIIGILNNKQSCAINEVSYGCGNEIENGKESDETEEPVSKEEAPTEEDTPEEINHVSPMQDEKMGSEEEVQVNLNLEEQEGTNDDVVSEDVVNQEDTNNDVVSEDAVNQDDTNNEVVCENTVEDIAEDAVDDNFLQDRLPFLASSTSAESAMLNPVEHSRLNDVENIDAHIHPTEQMDEKIQPRDVDTNDDENFCPNKKLPQDDEIKTCPAVDEEQPVIDDLSSVGMEERGVLLTIDNKKTVEDVNRTDRRSVVTGTCCTTIVENSPSNDAHFDELVKLVDAIPPSQSESTVGESEEVVMGVAVEGLTIKPPTGGYGLIIDPALLAKANGRESYKTEESDVNVSRSSQYYADMILNVTNFDDSIAQEVELEVEESDKQPDASVVEAGDEDKEECNEGEANEETIEDKAAIENEALQSELNDTIGKAEITTDLSNMDQYHKIKSEISIPDISFGEMDIEVTDSSFTHQEITEAKTDIVSNVHLNGVISPSNSATIKDDLNQLKESMKKNSRKLGKGQSLFGYSSVNALWNKA